MSKELILEMCKEIVEGKQNKVTGFKCQGISCEECPISIFNNNTPCNENTEGDIITTAKKYIAENTEFDWVEFKRGSIAVLLDTEEKIDDFLKECDKHDIRWGTAKASECMRISREGISENCYCCYRMYSVLEYCYKAWYESEGKTIVIWEIKGDKNMFKVGDRVKRIDNRTFSNGDFVVTVKEVDGCKVWFKETDTFLTDKRIKLVEETTKKPNTELTFKEVIADIKEGEVWESNSIAYDIKTIEMYNGSIEIKRRNMDNEIFIRKETLFKLQRKQYTFTEAFAAYEEGKEIESLYDSETFLKEHEVIEGHDNWFDAKQIRNKWYINN